MRMRYLSFLVLMGLTLSTLPACENKPVQYFDLMLEFVDSGEAIPVNYEVDGIFYKPFEYMGSHGLIVMLQPGENVVFVTVKCRPEFVPQNTSKYNYQAIYEDIASGGCGHWQPWDLN